MDWQPLIVLVQRQAREAEVWRDALKELEKLGQAEGRTAALEQQQKQAAAEVQRLHQEAADVIIAQERKLKALKEEIAVREEQANQSFDKQRQAQDGYLAKVNANIAAAERRALEQSATIRGELEQLGKEIAALTVQRDELRAEIDKLAARFVRR